MANDLISRQAAIGRIEKKLEEVYGYTKTEYSEGYVNACHAAEKMLNSLPSAQPNTSNTLESLDCIDRQAAIIALAYAKETGDLKCGELKGVFDVLNNLPSAQSEVQPIGYQDCANAMLRMWMDNVITDGEYNRVMDKLNAHWKR